MATVTVTEEPATETTEEKAESSDRTVLKLNKEKAKQIKWSQDTVDNEGLGKRKSKSCCIYKKPRATLDESSESESDSDDSGSCSGHKK